MKKFFAMFLVIAFLIPAFAYAEGSYCVSFPTSGNSKWTKRDNNINARFRYTYRETIKIGNELGDTTIEKFAVSAGNNRGYRAYPYGNRELCVHSPLSGHLAELPIRRVRLDIKWGGDCEEVAVTNGVLSVHYGFEIYRRKGDHINPWGCRRR